MQTCKDCGLVIDVASVEAKEKESLYVNIAYGTGHAYCSGQRRHS